MFLRQKKHSYPSRNRDDRNCVSSFQSSRGGASSVVDHLSPSLRRICLYLRENASRLSQWSDEGVVEMSWITLLSSYPVEITSSGSNLVHVSFSKTGNRSGNWSSHPTKRPTPLVIKPDVGNHKDPTSYKITGSNLYIFRLQRSIRWKKRDGKSQKTITERQRKNL